MASEPAQARRASWLPLLAIGGVLLGLLPGRVAAQRTTADVARVRGEERTLRVGAQTRRYLVHLPPSYDGTHALPVVLVLHGGGGSADGMASITGFSAKADSAGFIVVYPMGTGPLPRRLLTWNSGNCCGSALDQRVDDVGYIRALLDHLSATLRVDTSRVYATGLSNGAMMTHRLGCELSDRIAAIAPVAGALNIPCSPARPVAALIMHGTADQHVLFGGGEPVERADVRHPRVDEPVSHALAVWRTRNGCPTTAEQSRQGPAHVERYRGCRGGTEVALWAIDGEGHTWPGGKPWSRRADPPSREVSATGVIWEFFSRHAKK